jgi:hypothetical protein
LEYSIILFKLYNMVIGTVCGITCDNTCAIRGDKPIYNYAWKVISAEHLFNFKYTYPTVASDCKRKILACISAPKHECIWGVEIRFCIL